MTVKFIQLTSRFEKALNYSFRLHKNQVRKGTGLPYFAHILSTAALVIEDGGSEDEAIAALLHDAVEDQGGLPILKEIQDLFGERVAVIVDGCTDAYVQPKPEWRIRKENYLKKLIDEDSGTRRVSLADKVHNARSLLDLLYKEGDQAWSRFNGGKEGTIWYYQSLVEIFRKTGTGRMTDELAKIVDEILKFSNFN